MKTVRWARINRRSIQYAISPIIPMAIHITLMNIWIWNSPQMLHDHRLVFVAITALVFSYLCNQLVVCRVTRMTFPIFNPILLIPIIGVISAVVLRLRYVALYLFFVLINQSILALTIS